jgi:hypothetical protein
MPADRANPLDCVSNHSHLIDGMDLARFRIAVQNFGPRELRLNGRASDRTFRRAEANAGEKITHQVHGIGADLRHSGNRAGSERGRRLVEALLQCGEGSLRGRDISRLQRFRERAELLGQRVCRVASCGRVSPATSLSTFLAQHFRRLRCPRIRADSTRPRAANSRCRLRAA